MTEIAFHFNAPDKLGYACRVARKLLRQDRRLVVCLPEAQMEVFDGMLWNMAPHDFVAHCRADEAGHVVANSPIVLTQDARIRPHAEVLLNLADDIPEGFGSFEQLIEVVSANDENDRTCARSRWKHYVQRGYALVRHDLEAKGA